MLNVALGLLLAGVPLTALWLGERSRRLLAEDRLRVRELIAADGARPAVALRFPTRQAAQSGVRLYVEPGPDERRA